MVLYQTSTDSEVAIEAIRSADKSQFHQDTVMRIDDSNWVSF